MGQVKHSHYKRDVSHLNTIDVYRIIDLFGVTCPVAQHVLKKSLAAGQRGHKDLRKDWQDIMDSAERRLQMLDEDYAAVAHLAMPATFGQQNVFEPASEIDDESDRIQAIGQNGNGGEHYLEKADPEKLLKWEKAPEEATHWGPENNAWHEAWYRLGLDGVHAWRNGLWFEADEVAKDAAYFVNLESRPCAN
jgi:hypothetical protein